MEKPIILCVDDERTILDSLKVELKRALGDRCLIETAEGGPEALELFEDLQRDHCEIAVVVTDYIMPGLRGDELLQRIHARSPKTLNIMISGQADLEGVGRAIHYGKLYRFLTKPWHREDFRLTVGEAVESYVRERQLEAQTVELQQLYQQLQEWNVSLEQQVQERTAQLQQQMVELEGLTQVKDDFLHAVSHDLRTPLLGMLLVLRNAQQRTGEEWTVSRSVLDRMVGSCERQLQLLNMLLNVHLAETQGLVLQREWVDLCEMVRSVVQDLEPLVAENQAVLRDALPESLPLVIADSCQVRRVLENLISNALKHNPLGIEIVVHGNVQEACLRLGVQDSGVGISVSDQVTLFERYTRGATSRRTVGIGLGLYLCRQIVEAHGGTIGVVSAPGEGTEIWFTLPLAREG